MSDPLAKAQPLSGVHSLRVGSEFSPPTPKAGEIVPLKPTQFVLRDASKIPPRQWLYDKRLIAGFLALTVSPGGVGKSSLVLVEAVAMVTRRALLGAMPARPLTVWVWNGEDPADEIERRIAAICLHYGVTADELGYRLFTNSGRNVPINLAESGRDGLVIARPLVEELVRAILDNKIDVLVIDPFVTIHTVSENDNGAINAVVSLWREIADRTGCAIELVHHSSKMLGTTSQDVGIAQARGASALVDGVRSARFIAPMTKDEAEKAGLESPSGYFQVIVGKANLAPKPDDIIWRKMTGVALGNGGGMYPEGDYVGVAEVWQMPDAFDDVTLRDLKKAQDIIETGEWKCSPVANDWAGFAVADALGLDAGRGLSKSDRTSAQTWPVPSVAVSSRRGNPRVLLPKKRAPMHSENRVTM